MKKIWRAHNFEDTLNFVQKGHKYIYLWHEKSKAPTRVLITEQIKIAFKERDWRFFEALEESFY